MWTRYAGSASLAAFMTFGILFLMQYLVARHDESGFELPKVFVPELPNILEDTHTRPTEPLPEKIDPVVVPPMKVTESLIDTSADPIQVRFGVMEQGHLGKITPGPAISDGDFAPVYKVRPTYPHRGQTKGIAGYAIVEFTITAQGRVENARAIESSHRMFERPSIQAVLKFRYQPRVVHGEGVVVHGVRHKFTFELED